MEATRIVIPCYNESQRLSPRSFLDTLEQYPALSFLFVNDGSTDDTLKVISAMKQQNPAQVEVITLRKNSGKAEAVRSGMLMSMDGPFKNIGYWDADLATPLKTIGSFCKVLDSSDAEVVIGSRIRTLGRNIQRKVWRHYLGRILATLASLLLDIGIYDTQCGAKLFKDNSSLRKVFAKPFKVSWTFDVEMLGRFPIVEDSSPAAACTRWVEYPLDQWADMKGSKIKIRDYFKAVWELSTLFWYLRTPARKIYRNYLGS